MEKFFSFFLLFTILCWTDVSKAISKKTCFGTSSKFSVSADRLDHYFKALKRYEGCTTVEGNLEITGLESTELNTTFLKDIEVVTGYVIIALNYIPYLSLEKLRLIRGRELHEGNALFISVNYNTHDPRQRLERLRLSSLTEISRGSVTIENNHLCYVNAINWNDILTPSRFGRNWTVTIKNTPPPGCGKCHKSCHGGCWGEGPSMCQHLTREICSSQCGGARCRGPKRDDCCDAECAAGCTGPAGRDCLVCRHVNDSGVCKSSCPPARILDPQTQLMVPNPNVKYHYFEQCVDRCPSNLLVQDNSCVKSCTVENHDDGSGKCVPCKNKVCDKECYGVKHSDGPLAAKQSVDALNIHHFKGCNVIKGNLVFQSFAFSGDPHNHLPPMNASQLEVFKDVRNITGYLQIISWHKDLHDFSAFQNLVQIGGVELFMKVASLVIQGGEEYLTQITSLGFRSLKVIAHGNVYIAKLKQLCYADTIKWKNIIKHPIRKRNFGRIGLQLKRNNSSRHCNVSCDKECSSDGCWGPGPRQCVSCKHFSYNGTCVSHCDPLLKIYSTPGDSQCRPCHPDCEQCTGAGPENCTSCRYYREGGFCLHECPIDKYGDPVTKECLQCNESCVLQPNSRMCTGPNATLEEGGCYFCDYVVTSRNMDHIRCLSRGSSCPPGYFTYQATTLTSANHTCVPCYEGCMNCSGLQRSDCNHPLPTNPNTIIAVVITVFLALVITIVGFVVYYRQRKKAEAKKREYSFRALGLDPLAEEQSADPTTRLMEPMTPSGVAPNQAQMRIVKEAELRIGKILGSGAFGTVHKGYWIPDLAPKEKVKVPVAIKVLRDESSQVASNEILDEAFVMASCEHPNLVRLLGVCMSQRIMLITQLMPLGNLLEYVRENKDNIGSQHLLNWSLQIAKGMCFLAEEKHMVHRDLAARNVLVKSPNHVRITDFGLAKLLDVNEDAYRAEGGKMPIKWLALESIQHRIFTQKSDVWSFGVTMWELLTFGKRPYENIPAREVLSLLELGERLPQPSIGTIDIYMLLIKCWTVDTDARPTFRELVEELSRMARDPPRYIVIHNEGQLNELPSPTTSEFLRSLVNEEGDDFPITDAEEYLHPPVLNNQDEGANNPFSLQPPPVTVPWKRQHSRLSSTSSERPLFGGQNGRASDRSFKWRQGQSRNNQRHDSAVTTITTLSSESGRNGSEGRLSSTLPDICEVEFANGELPMHEFQKFTKVPNPDRDHRTSNDSLSDVFSTPLSKRSDHIAVVSGETSDFDQPFSRVNRTREDSATLRYSAEPMAAHRQHQAKLNADKKKNEGFTVQEEDGYLIPSEAANKIPEYLDPGEAPKTPTFLKPFGYKATDTPTALSNPDYIGSFSPEEEIYCNDSVNPSGMDSPLLEYENLLRETELHDSSLSSSRRHSQQSEGAESVKRDSGMQTDEENGQPKTAVSNPNYETLDDAGSTVTKTKSVNQPEYVNTALVDQSKFNFAEDDIFNSGKRYNKSSLTRDGRTYSEPDSGVGIDVAMDNILYHKLPRTCETNE